MSGRLSPRIGAGTSPCVEEDNDADRYMERPEAAVFEPPSLLPNEDVSSHAYAGLSTYARRDWLLKRNRTKLASKIRDALTS